MRLFLIRLALENVFKRRLRAFLTIGGVALSSAVMVVLFGLSTGLQNMVTSQIDQTAQRNVIAVSSKNTRILKITDKTLANFQSISGVTQVDYNVSLSAQVMHNGIALTIPMYAVSSGYFGANNIKASQGKIADNYSNGRSVVLSAAALKAFNLQNSIIGKPVDLTVTVNQDVSSKQQEDSRQIAAKDFTVGAVTDKGDSLVGYMPAGYLAKQGVDSYSQAIVQVAYPEKVPTVRQAIEQAGYETSNVQDAIDQVNRIFRVIRSILLVFALITTLITVFGTVNTITVELIEGTRQIGFLRIMGIRAADVGQLFIIESIILSVSGVLIGVAAGILVGLLTNGAIKAVANEGAVRTQTAIYAYQIPVWQIIIMVMLAVLLGWAIGLLPARRAVHINPLEALKL